MHYRDRFADLSNTLLETRPSIFLPSKLSLVFPSGLFTHVLHPQQNYTNYSRRHTVSKCQVSGLGHYNSYLKFQNARTVIYRECKGEHSSFLIQIFQPFFFCFANQSQAFRQANLAYEVLANPVIIPTCVRYPHQPDVDSAAHVTRLSSQATFSVSLLLIVSKPVGRVPLIWLNSRLEGT